MLLKHFLKSATALKKNVDKHGGFSPMPKTLVCKRISALHANEATHKILAVHGFLFD